MAERDPCVDPVPGDEVSQADGGRHFTVLDRYVSTAPWREDRQAIYAYQRGYDDARYFSAILLEEWHRYVALGTVWRQSTVEPKSWDDAPRWSVMEITSPAMHESGNVGKHRLVLLSRWLRARHPLVRRIAVEEVTRMSPVPALVPHLRKALLEDDDASARDAAAALKRLGPAAMPAVPALFWAAAGFRVLGTPQRYCACLDALVWIVPDHPRLLDLCLRGLRVPDYSIQSAAVVALATIRDPDARAVLRDVDAYRDTSVGGPSFDRLMTKVAEARVPTDCHNLEVAQP